MLRKLHKLIIFTLISVLTLSSLSQFTVFGENDINNSQIIDTDLLRVDAAIKSLENEQQLEFTVSYRGPQDSAPTIELIATGHELPFESFVDLKHHATSTMTIPLKSDSSITLTIREVNSEHEILPVGSLLRAENDFEANVIIQDNNILRVEHNVKEHLLEEEGNTEVDDLKSRDASQKLLPANKEALNEVRDIKSSGDVSSNDAESPSVDASTAVVGGQPSRRAARRTRSVPLAMRADAPTDIFKYYGLNDSRNNYEGSHLVHNSNKYGLATQTSQFIKNYNFERQNLNDPEVTYVGTPGFASGYHTYFDVDPVLGIMTRKTIKPTSDPNVFDIQVDIIGGAKEQTNEVDVVFVIDKSSSMNQGIYGEYNPKMSRWQYVNDAMKTFSEGILADVPGNNVQMALVGYGSKGQREIWSEISTFGQSTDFSRNTFTSESADVRYNTLITEKPLNNSGTPTFFGVRTGLEVLDNQAYGSRRNAKKIVVTLTDGLATFGPKFSNDYFVFDGLAKKMRADSRIFDGNGTVNSENSSTQSTIRYLNALKTKFSDFSFYSIGFGIGNSSNATNLLDALGKHGSYNATSPADLNEALDEIKKYIFSSSTIFGMGTITDPMSEYVELNQNSIKRYALTMTGDGANARLKEQEITNSSSVPSYARDAKLTVKDNTISVSSLTLGGTKTSRDGYRYTYQVTMKEDYRDGRFYPTNGSTYARTPNSEATFEFAVPSARVAPQLGDIHYKKVWNDDDNRYNLRETIAVQLQTYRNGQWENVSGQRHTLQPNQDLTGVFKNLIFMKGSQPTQYRIVEQSYDGQKWVTGYALPDIQPGKVMAPNTAKTPIVITNTLQTIDYALTKVGNDGITPLEGAGFTLYRTDLKEVERQIATITSDSEGRIALKSLPVGSYRLEETNVPLGYEKAQDITFTVDQDSKGVLQVISGPESNQIQNRLKPFTLIIDKKDQWGQGVKNVTFMLSGNGKSWTQTADVNAGSRFTFEQLTPGVYQLEEVVTPETHIALEKPLEIVIAQDGSVSYEGTAVENVLENNNTITITVRNQRKGLLPDTGGMGTTMYTVSGFGIMIVALILGFSKKHKKEVTS